LIVDLLCILIPCAFILGSAVFLIVAVYKHFKLQEAHDERSAFAAFVRNKTGLLITVFLALMVISFIVDRFFLKNQVVYVVPFILASLYLALKGE
jgi:hypothetical protein